MVLDINWTKSIRGFASVSSSVLKLKVFALQVSTVQDSEVLPRRSNYFIFLEPVDHWRWICMNWTRQTNCGPGWKHLELLKLSVSGWRSWKTLRLQLSLWIRVTVIIHALTYTNTKETFLQNILKKCTTFRKNLILKYCMRITL